MTTKSCFTRRVSYIIYHYAKWPMEEWHAKFTYLHLYLIFAQVLLIEVKLHSHFEMLCSQPFSSEISFECLNMFNLESASEEKNK